MDAFEALEDYVATPQEADLGLDADGGSDSFSGIESGFDAAEPTAASELSGLPVTEDFADASSDMNKAPFVGLCCMRLGVPVRPTVVGRRIHSFVPVQGLGITCQPSR